MGNREREVSVVVSSRDANPAMRAHIGKDVRDDVFDELDARVVFKASSDRNGITFAESPGSDGLRAGVDGRDCIVTSDKVEGRPCVRDVGFLEGVMASRP